MAGFAAFGDNPNSQTTPTAKIIMIKNFDQNNVKYRNTLVTINNAIRMYKDQFKIMNLSFSSKSPNIGYTRALDKISFENNIIIITSAGNVKTNHIMSNLKQGEIYPDFLKNYFIFFPGDCRNVVTVGSCTNKYSRLAPINAPSPFTKTNPYSTLTKPDVLANGGNIDCSITNNNIQLISQGYGLWAPSNVNNAYVEKHGTSFSAPIISNFIAQLYTKLDIDSSALLKALLLSSCDFLVDANYNIYDIAIQGYGKPNLDYALTSEKWRVCYLLKGNFNSRYPNHKDRYEFWFPEDADLIEITLVCEKSETVYPTEKNDYVELNVFHRPGASRRKSRTALKNVIGDVKCFNTYKGIYEVEKGSRGNWIVDIIPNFSTPNLMDMKIRYGCIITIIDTTKSNDLWNFIHDDWLIDLIGEYPIDEAEQDIGYLKPIILESPTER